jgi:N-succinyldiaminopimelate aminotransferase
MNPYLQRLQSYPFEKLRALKNGVEPDSAFEPILLSIGEPKHPSPPFIKRAVTQNLDALSRYPATLGGVGLRTAVAEWLVKRFALPQGSIDPETQVLPVNGTREALFSFVQCLVNPCEGASVLMPNPFYQIYEGAALLAGAEPVYLNCSEATGHIPDYDAIPESVWAQCQLLFVCSPGNPSGAVTPAPVLRRLLELADQFDFVIASDECYSEIYTDESNPPPGLLEVAAQIGRDDYRRLVVFNSLSKRSNVPGLRSGFVAGDAAILDQYRLYRTYHGSAMPFQVQVASALAWEDEAHVIANRAAYKQKFDRVLPILAEALEVTHTGASFYLWPQLPGGDDVAFTRELYRSKNVTLLPGSYLSRDISGVNPGAGYARIALVAEEAECIDAAHRMVDFIRA